MRRSLAAAALIALTACAASKPKDVVAQATPTSSANDTSVADCNGPVKAEALHDGMVAHVSSYSTTAGDVAAWHESHYTGTAVHDQDGRWRAYDPATLVSLCIYDGRFTFPVAPHRDSSYTPGDQPPRDVLLYVGGEIIWDRHGDPATYHDWTPPGATKTS